MAESSSQDAALKSSSVGVTSSAEITATTTDSYTIEGGVEGRTENYQNGIVAQTDLPKADDQLLEEGSTRSDTDTQDVKPAKKFTASKPISFAKYALPKTLTTNAPPKPVSDKVASTTPIPTSALTLGRPRLVAKATSSLQQKPTAYKPVTPDPNQVWNKNRVTPQPSTKHLTDEELKQQYGIHLTTRLQSDGEGKEAKWADIDDDEDDWAPETIEWNDGTKSTVNPAEALAAKANGIAKSPVPESAKVSSVAPKVAAPQYSSSVGPNATVLKVGANVERQQAQKAAQQARGSSDKSPLSSSKTAAAPAPVKSPWAKLPEFEKVSPIVINPQPLSSQPPLRYPSVVSQNSNQNGAVASPAKEISADDFNRQWRNSPTSQTRELFMPSSGRYETVSDGRRRMSRNEQNFRAPAVLQRPNNSDNKGPAEPSAAFQTNRTTVDQGRRRASSSISGTSGQFARRMSFKSNDIPPPPSDSSQGQQLETIDTRPVSQEGPSSQTQTPTYQARGVDNLSTDPPVGPDGDIEVQRVAQKALMKENIERARKRKMEEEQRMEAEKQERIRARLALLGPDPKLQAKAEVDVKENDAPEIAQVPVQPTAIQSPPKPPQPLATGEPQQYGMMKVHAMDSIKKVSPPIAQPAEPVKPLEDVQNIPAPAQQPVPEKTSPPLVNGARTSNDSHRPLIDSAANPEPSPKFNKPVVSMNADARAGWGNSRHEHRIPQASSLWGLPHNKALGNGTFDQSLAGYSPQDLSRTSSTGQGWMNGRTPTVGQSPQLHHATHQMPETRSHLLQSMTSPGQQPLTLNSEVDSVLPISRPAPIGPPQLQSVPPTINGVVAWNNFHNVARTIEKSENERFNREFSERREEESRTGVRQQPSYNFTETFKQVQLGEQAGQRQVSNVAQAVLPPLGPFGAVGSMPLNEYPSRSVNGQVGRGSRFFPPQANGISHERRTLAESHSETQRLSSPPPAEEIASYHPAFDGGHQRPVVHFPREKAVVRLPPAAPPAPPSPVREMPLPPPQVPLTWAARVQMAPPAPPPPPPQRSVSQPIAWQERFNGLLGRPKSEMPPIPAETSSKLPLDVAAPAIIASVLLPYIAFASTMEPGKSWSKDVEDEEDLFEDREAGSLPTIHFPRDLPMSLPILPLSRPGVSRPHQFPIDSTTAHMFMVNNWNERHGPHKPQYAMIKVPGMMGKSIRKDLPIKMTETANSPRPSRNGSGQFNHKTPRNKTGTKPRSTTKAH